MNACVILNPAARRGRERRGVRALREAVAARDDVELLETTAPEHGIELASCAGEDGAVRVIAAGGDGTVHEVVNGLMQVATARRPVLGVVPLGTGNDFAAACAVPRNPVAALDRALHQSPRPTDVGRVVDDAGRERWFINGAGMLLDGAINRESHAVAGPRGGLRYAIAALRVLRRPVRPWTVTVERDGVCDQREVVLLTIGNTQRTGGAFTIVPAARIDDGRLDLCTARPLSRPRMLAALVRALRGTHGRMSAFELATFSRLRVSCAQPMPIHLDGEYWGRDGEGGAQRIEIEALPGALRVARVGRQAG